MRLGITGYAQVNGRNTIGWNTKFGEIAFYPDGAAQQFSSREEDIEFASWITIV